MEITLPELEDAINYWRLQQPSQGEERALSKPVNALAGIYALMIFYRVKSVSLDILDPAAQSVLRAWLASK